MASRFGRSRTPATYAAIDATSKKGEDQVQSYEDIEGLTVNMGIITALILSFAVGALCSVTREDRDTADTLDLVYRYESFRDAMDLNGTIRASLGIPDNITDSYEKS